MNPFARLRWLAAPEDAPPGGTVGTPPASQAADDKKVPPAAPAEGDKKDGDKKPGGFLTPKPDDAGDKGKDGDAGKAPEAKATQPGADAAIEVKLPDGVKVDQALLDRAMPVFKELKLNSEQASKLAAFYAEQQKGEIEHWTQQGETWGKELEGDKEFGGKQFDGSAAAAQKAVLKYGGRELAEDLERYGISNLPTLARAFARIGKAMGEDEARTPRVDTKPKASAEKERLAKRYDSPAMQELMGIKD